MTHPIYIKRSVKEKLPTKDDYYTVIQEGWLHQRIVRYYPGIPAWEYNYKDITHWLEEVPLEEYLKEINYKNESLCPVCSNIIEIGA